MKYRHTQQGYVIMIALGLVAVGIFVTALLMQDDTARVVLLVEGILFLFLALIFSTLTIRITDHELIWNFGPIPLIKKRVILSDIISAKAVKTKIIEGWGIHLTRRGWLYNISGRHAVLIEKSDGKTFMLGTDEPEKLVKAIGKAKY